MVLKADKIFIYKCHLVEEIEINVVLGKLQSKIPLKIKFH